jgi:hypothetical protein
MSDLQPADFERADYRTVLRRLTSLDEKATGLRAEARRWYADRAAAADAAVQEAAGQLEAAERAVRTAQRDLERVDARAVVGLRAPGRAGGGTVRAHPAAGQHPPATRRR